jgi:hypothetical protein
MTPEIDITQILLQNGISALMVVVIFLILYFQNKKKADTLVIKDGERKEGTDEVARELNSQQEICMAKMEKDIEFIKLQVSNHLPTAMKEINGKLDDHIKNQNEFEKDILVKIAKL